MENLARRINFRQYALTCPEETSTILVTSYSCFNFKFLINLLLRLEPNLEAAKARFVAKCRSYYNSNPQTIVFLDYFEEFYDRSNVVYLYTTNGFLFHFINQALRSSNISAILLSHFIIVDLSKELETIYTQSISAKDNLQLRIFYRGQRMSVHELDEMKLSIGEFIVVKSFFSATVDLPVALNFAGKHGLRPKDEKLFVLFKITVDLRVKHTAFAELSTRSSFSEEREVLFTAGSIFSVENITYDTDREVWMILISLVDEDDQKLQDCYDYKNWSTLSLASQISQVGHLIRQVRSQGTRVSDFYYNYLLKELSANNTCCAICYSDLGWNAHIKGDYTSAISYQQKALERCGLLEKSDGQNELRTIIFNALGVTHYRMQNYMPCSIIA